MLDPIRAKMLQPNLIVVEQPPNESAGGTLSPRLWKCTKVLGDGLLAEEATPDEPL